VFEDYEILEKIGKGKYSQVFLGIHIYKQNKVVLKILKPVASRKVNRELRVLLLLQTHPNVMNLSCVLNNPVSKIVTLVSDYYMFDSFDRYMKLFDKLSLKEYMRQLLVTLDWVHSNGVIHRDVKPQNILYNFEAKKMKLIDFGLAEFYSQGKEMSPAVCSRYFKAPELLLGLTNYHYSIDIWAAGIIFASIVF
jgi:casein kinase II subunit alpha